MTNLKACFKPWGAIAVLLLLPVAAAQSQEVDNARAYALANQVADELELVRERMGRPYDDSPRLPVSAVTELELYFQTQSLLGKANQLAQELAGAAPRSQGPSRRGRSTPTTSTHCSTMRSRRSASLRRRSASRNARRSSNA